MDTLGKRIRQARGNVSQDEFSARIGISKGSLGFYERDENLPKVDVVIKICSETGVDLEWLMTGVGAMKTGEPIQRPAPSLIQHQANETETSALRIELEREREERRNLLEEIRQLYRRCLDQERLIGELRLALQAAGGEGNGTDAPRYVPSAPMGIRRNDE